MHITIGKIIALLIAIGYAVAMIVQVGGYTFEVMRGSIILMFPLALIWFPEEIGSMTGCVVRGGRINVETPPILVSIAGWFFLVGLPVIVYFMWQ